MDIKYLLGAVAVIVGVVGYIPYFKNIFSGKTKPHAFSWLVWAVLTAIAFAGQISSGGGAGTWVTGFTALICFSVFALALNKGKKSFPLIDWMSLAGAFFGLILWALTNSPLLAIVLVTIIDLVGFVPTFRKSFIRPSEETLFTYSMSSLKFAIGIIALREFSLATVLYPASLVISNGLFILMTAIRRHQLENTLSRG